MLQISLYLLELSLWGVTHHGIYFLHRIEICVLMVQFWCFATRFPLDSLNLHFIQCWIYFLLVTILHLVLLLFQACPIFSLGNFLQNVRIHDTFCIWKVFSYSLGFGYGSSHPKKFWWFMESPFLDLLQHRFYHMKTLQIWVQICQCIFLLYPQCSLNIHPLINGRESGEGRPILEL